MQLLIEGTTKYGYNLMTIHTRDNPLIGFAVGHLVISMNECSMSTRIFYEAISGAPSRKGIFVQPNWLISDDFASFYTELKAAIHCTGTRHCLCIWHVNRNW